MRLSEGQRLVRMQYVSKEVSEALVSQITKGFGIDVNIIFGDIDIVADTPVEGIVAIFDDEPVRQRQARQKRQTLTERTALQTATRPIIDSRTDSA